MSIRKRLYSAWKRHSLSTILRLIVTNIVYYISELFSGRLFKNAAEAKTQFDVIIAVIQSNSRGRFFRYRIRKCTLCSALSTFA